MLDDIAPIYGGNALRIIDAQAHRIAVREAAARDLPWAPIVADGGRCRYCVEYGRTCSYHNGSEKL